MIDGLLTPLIDDRLEATGRTLVEQHLEGCAACRETYALLVAIHQTLVVAGPTPVPAGLADRCARTAFTAEPV